MLRSNAVPQAKKDLVGSVDVDPGRVDHAAGRDLQSKGCRLRNRSGCEYAHVMTHPEKVLRRLSHANGADDVVWGKEIRNDQYLHVTGRIAVCSSSVRGSVVPCKSLRHNYLYAFSA